MCNTLYVMAAPVSGHANDFIEQQLDDRLQEIEKHFEADCLSCSGPIILGIDNLLRFAIETKKAKSNKARLVVVLTTAGGYIEIVQRMVDTMRHHYATVDFIIPNYAYSAGTVLALSGDAIHMDYYSRLGPIDPQLQTAKGLMVPALGYLEQYERLIKKAQDGKITQAEVQLLINGFDQAELYQYEQARKLSISLIKEWLVKYKFKNWNKTETRGKTVTARMRARQAGDIARLLNKTEKWHIHGYGISMDVLRKDLNLKIDDFGENKDLDKKIRGYYNLLDDYMIKKGDRGVLHIVGIYRPYR